MSTAPSSTAIPAHGITRTTDFVVPAIEGLESHIQRFARERDWNEVPPFAWQELSPLDPNKVAEEYFMCCGYEPVLPGITAFFGRGGKPAAVLVKAPKDAGICEILETYEDAIREFKIAYKLVTFPPKFTPGLLFLAPGETGEVVKRIFAPTPPL